MEFFIVNFNSSPFGFWLMLLDILWADRYILPEQVPIQYGGLSVDYCDCNPEFTIADPVTEVIIKPAIKQTVEIIIYEVGLCLFPF